MLGLNACGQGASSCINLDVDEEPLILNVFEEVSYLKDTDTGLLFPFFLTILNSPSIVYETFPFIFFISTQFLFIRLLDKEELDIFKKVSLSNFKIISVLSAFTFILSIFILIIFCSFDLSKGCWIRI